MVEGLRACAQALEGSSASAIKIKTRFCMIRVSFPLEPVHKSLFNTKCHELTLVIEGMKPWPPQHHMVAPLIGHAGEAGTQGAEAMDTGFRR
jgi:hypothetical protein